MNINPNNVSIIGMDEDKSYCPDTEKKLYNIYLKLSDATSIEWQNIFDNIWKHTIYGMKRRAWIEGRDIVICCTPEEIKKHHLDRLKEAVAKTNEKYKEYREEEKRRIGEKRLQEQKEKDRLKSIKDDLDF